MRGLSCALSVELGNSMFCVNAQVLSSQVLSGQVMSSQVMSCHVMSSHASLLEIGTLVEKFVALARRLFNSFLHKK